MCEIFSFVPFFGLIFSLFSLNKLCTGTVVNTQWTLTVSLWLHPFPFVYKLFERFTFLYLFVGVLFSKAKEILASNETSFRFSYTELNKGQIVNFVSFFTVSENINLSISPEKYSQQNSFSLPLLIGRNEAKLGFVSHKPVLRIRNKILFRIRIRPKVLDLSGSGSGSATLPHRY